MLCRIFNFPGLLILPLPILRFWRPATVIEPVFGLNSLFLKEANNHYFVNRNINNKKLLICVESVLFHPSVGLSYLNSFHLLCFPKHKKLYYLMAAMGKKNNASEESKESESTKIEHNLSESEEDSSKEDNTQNKSLKKTEDNGDSEDFSSVKKRSRGAKQNSKKEPQTKKQKLEKLPAAPINDAPVNDVPVDFKVCEKTAANGEKWNFKISSWNVAGIRAWCKKEGYKYITEEQPDILCLQETKCPEKKLPSEVKINGYTTYWLSAEKDGYSGVALYTKQKPLEVTYGLGKKDLDNEGRLITAEYEKFYLVAVYVPNAGQGLKTLPKRMQWDKEFQLYLKKLDEKKPVILTGDLNVAHEAIDLANPKTNTRSAGFTKEERDGMTEMLKLGFVDTFRHLYPEQTGAYTFWTYMGNARSRNTGWRLDYFILSERLLPHLCDNVIRSQVMGSDHCPVTLFLHL